MKGDIYEEKQLEILNRELINEEIFNCTLIKKFKNFYFGLSYSQLTELTFELIKLCPKINYDIDKMVDSYHYYSSKTDEYNSDTNYSISYYISNNMIGLSFKFNETYINCIKKYGGIYDKKNSGWLVKPEFVLDLLQNLLNMEADCICSISAISEVLEVILNKVNEKESIIDNCNEDAILFYGKSPTNSMGYFQSSQKKFNNAENDVITANKQYIKQYLTTKFKNFKKIFK